MGQLSRADALNLTSDMAYYFRRKRADVRENFDEMDFENADKRTRMEEYILSIEAKYNSIINTLDSMGFE